MDWSALIFVALAVAWAAYLIPVAIRSHDDAVRSRSVERFSNRMRVLARREPVGSKTARLVVTPGRPASTAVVVTKPSAADEPASEPAPVAEAPAPAPVELTPAQRRARREAARRATKRRRNVLAVLLVANAVVALLAGLNVFSWWWTAAPGGLLVAWLVLCRVMVKGEQAALAPRASVPAAPAAPAAPEASEEGEEQVVGEVTEEISVVTEDGDTAVRIVSEVRLDPTLWDPVPVTLPTYVSKPAAARRTVRTIELDDTGVWSSGHAAGDSQLAREAEQADRAEKAQRSDGDDRAVGS
ncbi:hypothetical protein [Nocardioides lianchengensis]|uniref:Uncharacterized protein n=1 Tax=Nocardioides lianchengensis TaxID=1045774 RepID=A0A1G6Z868_9ACTN|nr:hypothetical protein [Nocardioides lianchengensis]NYG11503.1 hypothetical protein [Nocardioides lianchengensis]SDD98075.1 hypothetical protein SAMN05421872_11322 [Nocardioides lianchengensis]